MAEPKTRKTSASVDEFLAAIDDETRREDCRTVAELMRAATGAEPAMWGASIVGFGKYHYKYASGREGDWFLAGFSPRKEALTLYIMPGFSDYDALMGKLGKFKTGKSCLYLKRLDDVDLPTLKRLIEESVRHMRRQYPSS